MFQECHHPLALELDCAGFTFCPNPLGLPPCIGGLWTCQPGFRDWDLHNCDERI